MKKILFFSFLSSTLSFGQTKDSVKVQSQPKLIVSTFIETQVYLPAKSNTFDMVYKFSGGGIGTFKVTKNISAIIGMLMWQNAAEKYGISSRAWVQGGFHRAFAFVYTFQTKQGQFSVGPAVANFSYVLSGIPAWHDNKKFQALTKTVLDTVPGIRGDYYTALYLFARYQKRTSRFAFEAELNLVVPGTLPTVIASWQPRGSLVHAIRTKFIYEKKRMSFKADIQIPTIAGTNSVGYKNLMLREITGKVEVGYSFKLNGGTIKIVVGYESDWHALNFPMLLKKEQNEEKQKRGTWRAPTFGIRFENFMKSKK